MNTESEYKYKGGKITEIVIETVTPFLEKLRKNGIKATIGDFIPMIDADNYVLEKIKNQLVKKRQIELGSGLGRIDIQYRFDGIQIEPVGVLRFIIKKITITDEQILKSFDDILKQLEEKYIKDDNYIINEIDDIIFNLSNTEIYKPKTSEEKTLYDLAMLILVDYYNKSSAEKPLWLDTAFSTIKKGKFVSKWIDFLAEYISELISEVSENIFINFKVTFDSFAVRTFLNQKTNRGQISKLIKMCNIDVKKIIYNFAKSYLSPSFIRGASEIMLEIASGFLSTSQNKLEENINSEGEKDTSPYSITVSLGDNPFTERKFRWYSKGLSANSFLEYSYDENFSNSIKVQAEVAKSLKLMPVLHLGLVSSFKLTEVCKYSCSVKNLSPGKIYYKIVSEDKESDVFSLNIKSPSENNKFIILTDSQGMVKSDYDVFLKMLESAEKNTPNSDFIVHLGDFVDNGNNEEFWNWILNSKTWSQNAVIPLSGNHEALVNSLSYKNKIENSVFSHFNIMSFPKQEDSSGVYYSFVYNSITFIVLNTNMGREGKLDSKQYKWALNTAKNAKTPWKIILTHKMPYSNGPHHNDPDVKAIGKQIINLAYAGKVDAVFGGHDHVYVRTSILAQGEKIYTLKVKNAKNADIFKTYNEPEGTIFVTPGTSGVKNYAQHFPISFYYDKMLKLESPVYSEVEADSKSLKFKALSWDSQAEKFDEIDSFELRKSDADLNQPDSAMVSRFIENIPDCPWIDNSFAIARAKKLYEELDYQEKIITHNYSKLLTASKRNESYKNIISGEIRTVKNKKEFLEALNNKKVSTIVTNCDEIKFENKFSFGSKIIINRPICIRGEAKLSCVRFILKENAFVILADRVCVDNTRKPLSLYKALDCFEMQSGSVLIVNDYANLNCGYGTGFKGYAVNMTGEKTAVYFNGLGYNFSNKGVVYASSADSHVVVNSGKYLCFKNHFAFNVNGVLEFKGGFARNIKGYVDSKISIEGGTIGERERTEFGVPMDCMGELKLRSGKIYENNGISIKIDKNQDANNFKLSESIEIMGKILYY